MIDDDNEIPFLVGSDFTERRNVAWRVELGQPDGQNPIVEPATEWDSAHPFLHGTVLQDPIDGLWKAWGTAAAEGNSATMQPRRLAYLESEDGINWQRPNLDINHIGSHQRSNILLDINSGGNSSYASVLVEPNAPKSQRYQMFLLRRPGEPKGIDGISSVRGFQTLDGKTPCDWGLYRYYSHDGLHWQPDKGPVLINDPDIMKAGTTSDSIFVYRNPDGGFVAYHKTQIASFPGAIVPYELGPGGCRILVRRTSEDGVDWSPHEPCMLPDWRDSSDTQFMEISVTPLHGGYLGIVTVYRAASQTLELQFAASRDGRHWWRPNRRPCITVPPLGNYGGGMMWGSHHMVTVGDTLHFYYTALQGLHGDMFSTEEPQGAVEREPLYRPLRPLHGETLSRASSLLPFHGALCRATWVKSRLWALTTATGGDFEGTATTATVSSEKSMLTISASTLPGGTVLAELLDGSGKVVEGFSREESDGFSGDADYATLTWRGTPTCPRSRLRARFILRRACLYGFAFKQA